MKSKQLKSYNIPTGDAFIDSIDAKPNGLLVAMMISGFAMIIFKWSNIFGLMTILFSLSLLLFLPGDVLIYFFKDYLIMYNRADRNQCVLVYYDEVASWRYSWSPSSDYLYIELIDGNEERIEAFSKSLFEYKMRIFLKDKQKKVLK